MVVRVRAMGGHLSRLADKLQVPETLAIKSVRSTAPRPTAWCPYLSTSVFICAPRFARRAVSGAIATTSHNARSRANIVRRPTLASENRTTAVRFTTDQRWLVDV